MASSKEMQRRAKEVKKPCAVVLGLYKRSQIVRNEGIPSGMPTFINTPEGIQAYDTKVVSISIIPPGQDQPSHCFMTGYGASYMAKVMTGLTRSNEKILNFNERGNPNGWMLQCFVTAETDLNNKIVKQMVPQIIASLAAKGIKFPTNFKIECGKSPVPIGFVPEK